MARSMGEPSEDVGGQCQARSTVLARTLEDRRVPASPNQIEDQLVQLMNEHERPVYNFLLTLLRDPDMALDCAQDTFLRAYQNLAKGKPVNAPWLFKVARNRAMDEFRRRRHMTAEAETLEHIPVREATDQVLAVRSILELLSPSDREVLYLFDIAGFKTDEIGAMLGIRGSAVRQRLSRARERFRTLYGTEP
ncbi:MAG TPA: sigma-70 family RNA polymerase sigma factor [Chloroflexota bacterium]